MNKFITWLFYNSEYNNIQKLYTKASSVFKEAYDLWCIEGEEVDLGTWNHRKNVAAEFDVIHSLYSDILTCKELETNYKLGFCIFIKDVDYKKQSIGYYKTIARQKSEIISLNEIIESFQTYSNVWKLLGEGTLQSATTEQLHNANRKLKKIGAKIQKIERAVALSGLYPASWAVFFSKYNNKLTRECVEAACRINSTIWSRKEEFLVKTESKQAIVKIILGNRAYIRSSFGLKTLEIEKSILDELTKTPKNYSRLFDCSLKDRTKLKGLILGYADYGDSVSFSDDITLSDFYNYRVSIENTGCHFAELVSATKKNSKVITAYNKLKGGQSVIYIEDYISMGDKDSHLYEYIVRYNEIETLRSKVKSLQKSYQLGFNSLCGIIDADVISVEEINNVLAKESEIKVEDSKLLERKRRQEEEERRRREEEQRLQEKRRIEQEIESLKKKISSWNTPSYSSVRCFALYNYYPTNCGWEVDNDGWDTRNLIWDFKANPNKPMSSSEIRSRHEKSMMKVLPKVVKCLEKFFGGDVRKLTLVCIPSSKQEVTERRYQEFSQLLSQETGMANGFDYITVIKDGGAKHLGQDANSEISINTSFFKNRYILLFDDVITSGRSMEKYARLFKRYGATVICGMSIGQTKHTWATDPIDLI